MIFDHFSYVHRGKYRIWNYDIWSKISENLEKILNFMKVSKNLKKNRKLIKNQEKAEKSWFWWFLVPSPLKNYEWTYSKLSRFSYRICCGVRSCVVQYNYYNKTYNKQ